MDAEARTVEADLYDSWLETYDTSTALGVGFSTMPLADYMFTEISEPVMLFEMSERELTALLMELMQGFGVFAAGSPGIGWL